MDVTTYAAIADLCARFAGRLSDDVLDAVRVHYAAGEEVIAESALLLGLAFEGVGVTPAERDLIRSVLDDPHNPDLDAVPAVDQVPAPAYRFTPAGPPTAPDPTRADQVLATEAPRHGGRRLRRTWRAPLNGDADGAKWVYVLQVAPGTDELSAYSGLSSRLHVTLSEDWQIEPVVEGALLPPYQAAALTAAHQVWTA